MRDASKCEIYYLGIYVEDWTSVLYRLRLNGFQEFPNDVASLLLNLIAQLRVVALLVKKRHEFVLDMSSDTTVLLGTRSPVFSVHLVFLVYI